MNFKRTIALTALALTAALPVAAATMSNNCRVRVSAYETPNGVHARVVVEAAWGALIDGDLMVSVNGSQVKLEPVLTSEAILDTTWIAPPGQTVSVCARVVGKNWITVEHWLPADTTACTFWSAERTGSNALPPSRTRETYPGAPVRLRRAVE